MMDSGLKKRADRVMALLLLATLTLALHGML